MRVTSAWRQADRDQFRAAMICHGHNQATCAVRLIELGAPSADQGAVSRWMTGATARPRPRALAAIQGYVEEVGLKLGYDRGKRTNESARSSEDEFLDAVRDLTEEPLLSPRQAAFIDAQIARLASGDPMSDADDAARRSLLEILGLAKPFGV